MPRESSRSSRTLTDSRGVQTYAPRIVVASGMQGTGVSTITDLLQRAAPSLAIIDAGSTWASISAACEPWFTRLIAVTTQDIVAVSSTYALVKMVRDRFPGAPVEVLVNFSEAREALKTYERVQVAASHFLRETIGYAGAVPDDGLGRYDDHVAPPPSLTEGSGALVGEYAVSAVHDLALRLDEELSMIQERTTSRDTFRNVERRMIQ